MNNNSVRIDLLKIEDILNAQNTGMGYISAKIQLKVFNQMLNKNNKIMVLDPESDIIHKNKTNHIDLDKLEEEVNQQSKYELEQFELLKKSLKKLHLELIQDKNNFAAGYLSTVITRIEEEIKPYVTPVFINKKI